jgi:hypothetical protein
MHNTSNGSIKLDRKRHIKNDKNKKKNEACCIN